MGILDRILRRRPKVVTYEIAPETLRGILLDVLQRSILNVVTTSSNLSSVGGVNITGRDWTQDIIRLQNLDISLSSRASETTLQAIKAKTDNLDVALSTLATESTLSSIRSQTDKLTFDANNRLAIQNPPNLDVLLSTRASETTLSSIKSQTDKLTFDASNRLAVQNPPNLDVALSLIKAKTDNLDVLLSTRASESTLSAIKSALASVGTDKLRTTVVDALPESPHNLTKVGGTALTGRDWSGDFAKLQNLDTTLSSRASETTLSGIKSQTDKLTFDTSNRLAIQNPPNLDVALSTRASESTLSGIKTQTDKLTFDTSNYLQVNVKATVNPSNLDVALSTRASESTLSGLSGKFPSAAALSDSLSNPTTTIIGDAMLGFDGTYWRRVRVDTSGRLAIQNPPNMDVTLSTLATLQRFGRNITLSWVDGGEVTAPAANTALVTKTVTSGKSGYIYGFFISAGEGNIFKINWTSGGAAKSRRIVFNSSGTLQYVDFIAINEGVPADGGTNVTITNVNAGSSGVVYQCAILYGEV